jgi:hypothetical protein
MDFKDLAAKVVSFAPVLGTVIGGPAGAAAGTAVASLAKVFGLKEDATPDQIGAAISTDPDAAMKVKLAEMDYQNQEKQRELAAQLQEQAGQLADVQNARQMNVDNTKATGKRDTNLYLLAWVIVFGFFALVGLLIFKELPKDSNGVIFMLFGALASGFTGIIGYFFGSSAGHAEATRLLAQAPPIPK